MDDDKNAELQRRTMIMNSATLGKMMAVMAVAAMTFVASAESEVVDGVTWYYTIRSSAQQGQTAMIDRVPQGGVPYAGDLVVPTALGGCRVDAIGTSAFANSADLKSVVMPDQITSIGTSAFVGCANLVSVKLSSGVTSLPISAFGSCVALSEIVIPEGTIAIMGSLSLLPVSGVPYALKRIVFPSSITQFSASINAPQAGLSANCPRIDFKCPCLQGGMAVLVERGLFSWRCRREDFASFKRAGALGSFVGFLQVDDAGVSVVSSEIRKNDPTIIDLVYKVTSKFDSVNVRVIAFEDGERSFAKAVVPMTFVDGTDANVGDGIAANVEHKISWQVSSDWAVDLAKVKVEVLSVENGILPLELMRLPALDGHAACEFSWNAISFQSAFDALLWLYADQDSGISVCDGTVSRVSDGAVLAKGGAFVSSGLNTSAKNAVIYVLEKMGYSPLEGDDLAHVNEFSRLGLASVNAPTVPNKPVVSVPVYAYKQVD